MVIVLTMALIAALIACLAEGKVIKELSHQLEDAQMWIDPIEWEETDGKR